MTPEEILRLVENYESQEKLAATGFQLAGQKYFYLRYTIATVTTALTLPSQRERRRDARQAGQGRGARGEDPPGEGAPAFLPPPPPRP